MIVPYWLRALAVCLANFTLLYVALSAAATLIWRTTRTRRDGSPNVLFALLTAPMLLSLASVTLFAAPAFLYFEPVASNEPWNWSLRIFATAGASIVTAGICRSARAWISSTRAIWRWTQGAVMTSETGIVVTGTEAPAVVVVGLARQKLLISKATNEVLSADELRLVIAHEREHARRRDNLRKLALVFCETPWNRELIGQWGMACELAADRAAARTRSEACDLAAALVKVSRLAVARTALATNFAAASAGMLDTRVRQLISWEPSRRSGKRSIYLYLSIATTVAASAAIAAEYSSVLRGVQALSELWMR